MQIAILDLGVGNLHSLAKALQRASPSAQVSIREGLGHLGRRDLLVLPGVGAFSAAAARLVPLRDSLRQLVLDGQPTIGICLGMQLLFDESEEGLGQGLGVCPGKVTRLTTARTPHMGFSHLQWSAAASWLPDSARAASVYYAHSFACRPRDEAVVLATTHLAGDAFAGVVRVENTIGFQFHPEKSSDLGIALLSLTIAEVCKP